MASWLAGTALVGVLDQERSLIVTAVALALFYGVPVGLMATPAPPPAVDARGRLPAPLDHPRGPADPAAGTLILPDGTCLRLRLTATADLLAEVAETGQLWFAGVPAPGRALPAGFPHAPLAAAATFRAGRPGLRSGG